MKRFLIQTQKDFTAYFNGFLAYIIIAVYSILSLFSALYIGDYFVRDTDIMNSYFILQPFILLLIIPAITMRSWADEFKSGTIELLLTQPISYFQLVSAKFFAAYLFFGLLVFCSFPFLIVTATLTSLDWGIVVSAYCGLLLCGALFTAIGVNISSLCRHSITSFICTIFALIFIMQFKLKSVNNAAIYLPLDKLNFYENYNAFLSGELLIGNIVYFIISTILLVWLNTVIMTYHHAQNKKMIIGFSGLLILIFLSITTSCYLFFNTTHDITHNKLYTLTEKNKAYLNTIDQRIDITLYEAKSHIENSSSTYAAYAEIVERLLKQLETHSFGAIKYRIVRVEPFSDLERKLISEGVPFEENSESGKSYLALTLSDNQGNSFKINTLNSLRLNLLEADIMRAIRLFGQPKKNIALICSSSELDKIQGFQNLLKEFYNLTYLDDKTEYLTPSYDAIILFNLQDIPHELFVALDQYILHGGNIIFFSEPDIISTAENNYLIDFLNTYGIHPVPQNVLIKDGLSFGFADVAQKDFGTDISSVLINNAGKVNIFDGNTFHVSPLLSYNNENIAVMSLGNYKTNYPTYTKKYSDFLSSSAKSGKFLFFYDSDLIKDYLYIAEESKGTSFYQIISFLDNLPFQLRLMDKVSNSFIEKELTYHHYTISGISIGLSILTNQRQIYQSSIDALQQEVNLIRNELRSQKNLTSKDVSKRVKLVQRLDKAEAEIDTIQQHIMSNYQAIIAFITISLVLLIPLILICFLALFLYIYRQYKKCAIRRMMSHAKTN